MGQQAGLQLLAQLLLLASTGQLQRLLLALLLMTICRLLTA
jgi:hypothetical protein